MDETKAPPGGVPLSAAIGALRDELTRAWWDGRDNSIRFKPSPVELTLQVGVTWTGKGTAGVKWWLIELGGETSRESVATQTVKLSLEPKMLDAQGELIEFLIEADDARPASSVALTDRPLDAAG